MHSDSRCDRSRNELALLVVLLQGLIGAVEPFKTRVLLEMKRICSTLIIIASACMLLQLNRACKEDQKNNIDL